LFKCFDDKSPHRNAANSNKNVLSSQPVPTTSLNTDFAFDFPVADGDVDAVVAVAVPEVAELGEEPEAGTSTVSEVKEADTPLALVQAEGSDGTLPETKFTAAHCSS